MDLSDEQINDLITAISSIAYGNSGNPGGLEALAMSIAGEGPYHHYNSLSHSLDGVSTAIWNGLHDIANAIRETKN